MTVFSLTLFFNREENDTSHEAQFPEIFDKSKLNFLAKRYLVSAVYQVDRLLSKSN